jgi:hypothetical protein
VQAAGGPEPDGLERDAVVQVQRYRTLLNERTDQLQVEQRKVKDLSRILLDHSQLATQAAEHKRAAHRLGRDYELASHKLKVLHPNPYPA